ncbi:Der1-like protein [Microstroma glucosiphilum]|uniref:Derlin n=1 Tax=Pseudomicrostroma glucosiphilum TaxID=1684307 RepID=A0A316U374_9BASI|nr:Der1-like protein [Pseudomicrostroma glucosiphilum]PWN18813.1 Der1-like protein [Pseudomicrostroma glucosiphilum]
MDELLKIPPITRSLVGLVLLVSVGPILQLANPYTFLLWWPAILKKQQVWRLITCFFLTGGGNMQIIFDVFMLGRNTMELELNHFHRSTADFTWALMVIGSLIIATNYPLGSTVLFKPMLMAINYLWARSNAGATVSLFGVVSCPASLLPYAYLVFDLILGGLPLFIHSSTGLLAAYLYHQLRHDLPSNGGPRLIPTPAWLQRALPPSVDPQWCFRWYKLVLLPPLVPPRRQRKK